MFLVYLIHVSIGNATKWDPGLFVVYVHLYMHVLIIWHVVLVIENGVSIRELKFKTHTNIILKLKF